jgi:hypothetical protein
MQTADLGDQARLTVYETAERWARETPALSGGTLARLLAERVIRGAFEFPLPDGETPPRNFDAQANAVIEAYDLEGRPRTAFDVASDWFDDSGPSKLSDAELLHVARNTCVSLTGLSRFCEAPDFAAWAKLHDLQKPSFLPGMSLTVSAPDPEPPVRRAFSRTAVKRAYKDRVTHWPKGQRPPSRDEDVVWAKSVFGNGVSREFVRNLRKMHAPHLWSRSGRRKDPGNN